MAVDTSTEVGNRAVRVLLADADVAFIGVLGEQVPERNRSGPIEHLTGFDVLISDGTTDLHRLLGRCSVEDVALVLWHDADLRDGDFSVPVVTGANVADALTAALLAHPTTGLSDDDTVLVGWTEPGSELSSGEPVIFPDPIGPQWGQERSSNGSSRRVAAFRNDEWAGAVVDVDGADGRRIVGVSDHAAFMEAIVLAGTAIAVAQGAFPSGHSPASQQPEALLGVFNRLELEVATWHADV